MPIHDWTRLQPGDFHHFHQHWIQDIAAALNGGLLPPEYMALAQVTGRPIPDVVALDARPSQEDPGGVAVASAPPTARVIATLEKNNCTPFQQQTLRQTFLRSASSLLVGRSQESAPRR